MKKLLAVLSLFALFTLAVVPAFAQDDPGTIADAVIASTQAETPEFTVLLAAVQDADPMFLEALSNPESRLTVFAPTDAAFTALLDELGMSAEDLLANTDLLNQVLAYHVVPSVYDAASVVALNGALLGTLLPDQPLMVSVMDDAVSINNATVVMPDVMASNGVVHVIDTVLVPAEVAATEEAPMTEEAPTMNIGEIVIASTEAEAPEFTTLLAAVQAADPSVLALLTGGGAYTVFAPTDAAFAAALEALNVTAEDLLADTDMLNQVLAYHVLPGIYSAETVVAAAGSMEGGVNAATLLPGTTVSVMLDGESVKVNDATVTATNIRATNGIVHIIDTVILPPMQ